MTKDKIERLEEISEELSEIANSYAGDETGAEASLLHMTSGNIHNVIKSLKKETPLNPIKISKKYEEWVFTLHLLSTFSK